MSERRLPAEWEQHAATWMTWPYALTTWPKSILRVVQQQYLKLITIILEGEHVHLFVHDELGKKEVLVRLKKARARVDRLHIHICKTNDAWARDYGPDFLIVDGIKTQVNWEFNAWGQKYEPYDSDNRIADIISNLTGYPTIRRKEVLEGGSFETNGAGVFMTSESCLLNNNRNQFNKADVEQLFQDVFAMRQMIWLGDGIVGDDTDGHIDDMARFVNQNTIVYAIESDPADANYQPLKDNEERLRQYKVTHFPSLELKPIHLPKPVFFDGERLPASYLNFYICNHAVIVPVFDAPNDILAINCLQEVFTDREVIGLNSREVVAGLGSFHCLTKHECINPVDN